MEVILILAGVVAVIIYFINQNKTKVSDRTVVTQQRTIKTDDGEIKVHRTQVVDSTSTQYHGSGAPSVARQTEYDLQAINDYYKQINEKPAQPQITREQPAIDVAPVRVQPPAARPIPVPPPQAAHKEQPKPDQPDKKKCPRCSRSLPFDKYGKSSKYNDGMTMWCLECLRAPRDTPKMKYCPKCGKRRYKTSFYANSKRKDGLTLWCKECMDKSK
ncbi:hypothetical protein [Morganella morganii]|uniref:hypothetical protein n=1 Tax=Morganella morganii TaxID=582 RepID=UPI00052E18C0|nr:hypothetical protein [Morganella morganii]KGP45060.1 hypothetical protein LR61_07655 [Morganella morganii]